MKEHSPKEDKELETQVVEGDIVDDSGKAKKKVLVEATFTHHSGPLPHPDTLERYNEIVPGAAREILDMGKAAHAAVIENERKIVESAIESKKTGQNFAMITVVCVTALSGWLGYLGHSIASTLIITAGLASIVSVFITGKVIRNENDTENDNSQEETESEKIDK